MVLDECSPYPAAIDEARPRSMERIGRGGRGRAARRALELASRRAASALTVASSTNPGQAQFGIVQGGMSRRAARRERRARRSAIGFEGYAIGGLSVGEPVDVMYASSADTAPLLPADRPRYLMGTGTPDDLVECVARGIDMFDCVLPTRNARNGQLLTRHGLLHQERALRRGRRPLDPACGCYTCRHSSRAYLRHLFLAGEMTGGDPEHVA